MHLTKRTILWAIPLAFTLAVGAPPDAAEAQVCGRPGPNKGCVEKKDFKKNAVDSSRVKNNSLKSGDFANGSLTGADFQNGGLTGADIQDSTLTGAEIEDGSITAAALAPGADSDLAADLGCGDDQVARFTGSTWECVTAGASYVFISSQAQNGAFGETAWDGVCQADALAAGLPEGAYEAWLSTTLTDARDMLPPGPFHRTDGSLLALSKADLLDEDIFQFLNLQADGAVVDTGPNSIWTGTDADGTRHPDTCVDWTTTGAVGRVGVRNATTGAWTAISRSACGASYRVYCIQVQ